MRIIAGEHRGLRLEAPKGDRVRPTADRVKESSIAALESARGGFEGACVLDAFAGSGGLGIELLSRGADYAEFHEKDRSVLRILQENIGKLKLGGNRFSVVAGDSFKMFPQRRLFDVLLFDPPYKVEAGRILHFIADLAAGGFLAECALVLYEHDRTQEIFMQDAPIGESGIQLTPVFSKKYGETVVDILRVQVKEMKEY